MKVFLKRARFADEEADEKSQMTTDKKKAQMVADGKVDISVIICK